MEIIIKDYKGKNNNIRFQIKDKEINGITGKSQNIIDWLLDEKSGKTGQLIVDEKDNSQKRLNSLKKVIEIVEEEMEIPFFCQKIYERIYYEIRRKNLSLTNPKKKILEVLKMVGLDYTFVTRNLCSLSTTEKRQIQLAITLLTSPSIIIIKEPFKSLDKNNEKRMWLLLQKLKEQYNKTVIIISSNTNQLYRYTNNLIVIKNDKVLIEGNTSDIFQKVDLLKKNKIAVPEIVEFTYIVRKKKKTKIDYHKDVRDLIKDIYKHV